MSPNRTYFPPTTPQQRKLLFETWKAAGSVTVACQTAHVGRGTFYYWKPRWEVAGVAGLAVYRAKGPARGSVGTSAAVKRQVIELRQAHPDWGKQRLADELSKANHWVPLASANTVRRILAEAGLWTPRAAQLKKTGLKP